jgi:hypothetical protein
MRLSFIDDDKILPQVPSPREVKRSVNFEGIALFLCKRLSLPIGVLLAFACGMSAQSDNSHTNQTWRLKGSDFRLRLRSDGLIIERAGARLFSLIKSNPPAGDAELDPTPSFIAFSSITAVIKEVVTHRPVQKAIDNTLKDMEPENMMKMAEGAGEGAIGLPALPVILAATAGAMLSFRGVKTHIQSVRILWIESGVPRSTNLVLSGRDSESLSSRLAQMTGRVRTDVNFDNEARGEHASQMVLHFTQPVSIGLYTVWGGTYRLLLLKCSDSTNLVYFFSADKQMPQNALMTLTADSSPLGSEKPWKVKLRRDLDGSLCFTEIDTDTERLQVKTCHGQMIP